MVSEEGWNKSAESLTNTAKGEKSAGGKRSLPLMKRSDEGGIRDQRIGGKTKGNLPAGQTIIAGVARRAN